MRFKIEKEPKGLVAKFTFGKKGTGLGEFDGPRGLAIKDGYLYVTDLDNSRIQVFKIDSNGNLSSKLAFGKEGKGLGEFVGFPGLDLAIKKDYIFVADSGNYRIQVFKIDSSGNLLPKLAFGKEGKGLGEFGRDEYLMCPDFIHLAIRGDYLFVVDSGNSRIQVLKIDAAGNLSPKLAFGKEGKGLGEFFAPIGISVRGDYLFVADSGNSRIQVLKIDSDGNLSPKLAFGKEGKGLGEFFAPTSLAVGRNYLYVADTGNSRVQALEIKY